MGGIGSANPRPPVDGCEWVVLVEVGRSPDVGRNYVVVNADAIDLHRKQDGDAEFLEVASGGDGGRASPALPEENHTCFGHFCGIKLSVPICIESLADQLQSEGAMVVGDGFGIHTWCLAEFEDELANAAVRVIPAVVPAEEADDEG
jgi:hypothetical protein